MPLAQGTAFRGRATAAQWCIVVLLSVIATTLVLAVVQVGPQAEAQQVGVGGQQQGVFAVGGQITRDTYGLYLVDPDRGCMAMYEYVASERRLRLMATRNYTYDLQLDSYNTDPQPSEVAEMVRQARRIGSATTQP